MLPLFTPVDNRSRRHTATLAVAATTATKTLQEIRRPGVQKVTLLLSSNAGTIHLDYLLFS